LPPATKPSESSVTKWFSQFAAAVHDKAFADVTTAQIEDELPGVASHRPFWDPSDLLDVHHRLRC
jgi:hypothetical protein